MGHLYSFQHIIRRITNNTTRKPWMDPATFTASGTFARYLSGIAKKNKITVEIASHKAIC